MIDQVRVETLDFRQDRRKFLLAHLEFVLGDGLYAGFRGIFRETLGQGLAEIIVRNQHGDGLNLHHVARAKSGRPSLHRPENSHAENILAPLGDGRMKGIPDGKRNLIFLKNLRRRPGGKGVRAGNTRNHFIPFDHPVGYGNCLFGIELIVINHQFDFLPVDSAGLVDVF